MRFRIIMSLFAVAICLVNLSAAQVQDANSEMPLSTDQAAEQESAALERLSLGSFTGSELVVEWNRIVNEVAFAEDQFLTFKGVRAHAMMHIAMHDALNAIHPIYRQYACKCTDYFADPVAAAA